jgi:diguanylate cyclase (GGDEF)-like protein/PAS domain S-box-containing protein
MSTNNVVSTNKLTAQNILTGWLKQLGVAVLYLISGIVIHSYFTSNGIVSAVWPGSGLALAVLLIGGKRYVWGVALGALMVNIHANDSLWVACGITLASLLEVLLGVWLLTRNNQPALYLHALPEYLRLIVCGGCIPSIVGAVFGALSLLLANFISPAEYFENVLHWWMGDTLGVVLVTPFILAVWQEKFDQFSVKQMLEAMLLMGITFIAGQIVFLGWFSTSFIAEPKAFMMFLFITWVAIRVGNCGATFVALMIASQALWGASLETGYFAYDIAGTGLRNYWLYMLILSLVGMVVATYVNEIKRALVALQLKDSALDAAANGIVITDINGRIEWANQAFSRLTGFSLSEIYDRNHKELVKSGKQDKAYYQLMWKTILANKVWRGDLINRRKDGSLYHEEMTITPLANEQGEIENFVAVKQEITERKQAEKALQAAEERFRDLVNSTDGIVWEADAVTFNFTFVSQQAERLLGYPTEDWLKPGFWVEHLHPDDKDWAPEYCAACTGRLESHDFEYRFIALDGHVVWLRDIVNVVSENDAPRWLRGIMVDITERKAAEEEIKNLAFYDSLTRLPNRRLLLDRLKRILTSLPRNSSRSALLFVDLDNFKTLNDTLGHGIGDLLLQQVAQRLKSHVRECDTVARLGGDEFVVILEDLSEHALEAVTQTETIGNKILIALNEPYQLATHKCHNTTSIGAILINDYQQAADELLKQADIAMYQAKKAGRNVLRFFDPKMQDTINARAALEGELRIALENRQFHLYYQIQVDNLCRPLGAEALLRWLHPERGLVSPAQFVPLAEETGLILPIGQWVLETACIQLKAWQQDVLTRDLVLSVNVSAKQFRQTDFVAQVKAVVQRHAINPRLLKLELTESMLLESVEDTIATMNALKEINIQFSLDDFGTGYSSLQYLKRLPLNQLKIDQSFIRDIVVDSNDRSIVYTIIAMAQSLNLNVIAEGVETEDQQQLLLSKGCVAYQGYLFGKPVPIEQFETLLKQ